MASTALSISNIRPSSRIALTPTWAYPWIVKLSAELLGKGTLEHFDISDPECMQVISKVGDKYRMDNISRTGIATSYVTPEFVKLSIASQGSLLLEAVFGEPTPSDGDDYSPVSPARIAHIIEASS